MLTATTGSLGDILWTPPTRMDNDTILNPIVNPTDTTMYVLTVEQDLCTLVDSLMITVQYETLVESFDYEICFGDTIQLEYVGEADVIEWSPADGLSDPLAEAPLASPSVSTDYILNATLSTCTEDTALARVVVNPLPQVFAPASYDKFPEVAVQIELDIDSTLTDFTIEWLRFDGLSCNNCANPLLTKDTSGFYPVIITNELTGCETEILIFINLLKACSSELISMPNIFTPNDDGYNDKLEIFSETIEEIYIFRVFNRWGALVYETNDINQGWDGRYRGKEMSSGVYVYYLEAPCVIDGSVLLKKGDFTLVR